jgi:D-alanyl-D-alanine carboxypeptidase (penicillin-binding protein 5/6)
VLAARNENERMEPASITKLMTAYVVFRSIREKRIGLNDEAPISVVAWRSGGATSGGSTTFLDVGSRVPVETLLKGMIIQSGNDASVALAEYVAGTEEAFADLMNRYAKEIGLNDSSFRNSTGLPDPQHYTTAADIARLGNALIREFPEYYRWYSEKQFTFNGITQGNRNGLLYRDPTVDGMKTGYTASAGYCLVTSALRNGMRLVSVVLKTDSARARERASEALLAYGFRFYETKPLFTAGKPVETVRVWKGEAESVDVGVAQSFAVTLPRGAGDNLQTQVEVRTPLEAPLDPATPVGMIRVRLDDQVLAEAPLVPLAAVPEGSLWAQARDTVLLWFE